MREVTRDLPVSPGAVFAVLADGWSYAGWVVGSAHIRRVDAAWPAVGTRIHHTFGAWPFEIRDHTEVVACEPERLLELDARLWLFGGATVRFTLDALDGGGTRLRMAERAVSGPGGLVPGFVQDIAFFPRNAISLARLADVAIGREALAG